MKKLFAKVRLFVSKGVHASGLTSGRRHNHRLRWLWPVTGSFALIWFLIRVIPKPSRAT